MKNEEAESARGEYTPPVDWETWLDANGARLFLYARQQTFSRSDAEDVLQNALLQLVRTVECGDFRGDSSQWLAYALSAIRHLAVDEARRQLTRRNYRESFLPDDQTDNPWLHSSIDDDINRRHVEGVLQSLPSDYAEVLILRIWEELSFQQIARVTGENLSMINSRYRRALELFRKKLSINPMPQ